MKNDERYSQYFPVGEELIKVNDYKDGMIHVQEVVDAGKRSNKKMGLPKTYWSLIANKRSSGNIWSTWKKQKK